MFSLAAQVGANRAFADAPAPAFVSVSADEAEVAEALHALELVLRDTDPPGRSIDAAHAASVAKLGLVAKDTVRAVDGEPAVTLVMDRA
ncbi:MAG: hypothetical protein ACHQ17_12090, partial [Polyangia bacterium]